MGGHAAGDITDFKAGVGRLLVVAEFYETQNVSPNQAGENPWQGSIGPTFQDKAEVEEFEALPGHLGEGLPVERQGNETGRLAAGQKSAEMGARGCRIRHPQRGIEVVRRHGQPLQLVVHQRPGAGLVNIAGQLAHIAGNPGGSKALLAANLP